jgi:hypothetical protein
MKMRKTVGRGPLRAVAVVLFLAGALFFTRYTGLPMMVAGVILLLGGVGFYVGNVKLVRRFLVARAPAFSNDETWKSTSGMGVVPKWVTLLGWLAVPAFVAAGVWLLFAFLFGGETTG